MIVDNNLINNSLLSIDNLKPFPLIKEYDLSVNIFTENLNKNFDNLIFIKKKNKDRYFIIDRIVDKNKYLEFEKQIKLNKNKIFSNNSYVIYKYY